MNRYISLLFITLLVLTILPAVPVTYSTITGRPYIYLVKYYWNKTKGAMMVEEIYADPLPVPAGANFTYGVTYNITSRVSGLINKTVKVPLANYTVAIDLRSVSITGAQVWLWLSRTGGAVIEPEDVCYVGPFYVNDIYGTTVKQYKLTPFAPFNKEDRTYTFWVGGGWINGTIPLLVNGSTIYWIKLTDVSPELGTSIPSSDVSVSNNRIEFVPAFITRPDTVVPDQTITSEAYATPLGKKYNVTLTYLAKTETVAVNVTSELHTETSPFTGGVWVWSGWRVEYKAPDLKLRYPAGYGTIRVKIESFGVVEAEFVLTQPNRMVWFPGDWTIAGALREHGGDYTAVLTVETGREYNITVAHFPASGTISIYLNNTLVAANIALNATGGVHNYTIKMPDVSKSGKYVFRVIDSHGVEYNFTLTVVIVPWIEVVPDKGYVGDKVEVKGHNFQDYIGTRLNIWFEINDTHVKLLANFTCMKAHWSVTVVIPHAIGGKTAYTSERMWVTEDVTGAAAVSPVGTVSPKIIDTAPFEVLAKLVVIPDTFTNDGGLVSIVGTGFIPGIAYYVAIDNAFLPMGGLIVTTGTDQDFASGLVTCNGTGDLLIKFVAAGFSPGLHAVALYEVGEYEPAAVATFNVVGVTPGTEAILAKLDDVLAAINALNATLVSEIEGVKVILLDIQGSTAYIATTVGAIKLDTEDLKVMLTQLGDRLELKLDTVKEDLVEVIVARGNETVAAILAKLGDLEPVIKSVAGDVAYIKTKIGDVTAKVDDVVSIVTDVRDLVVTKTGDVLAKLDTAKGDVLASLDALKSLIEAGLKPNVDKILGEISDVKGMIKDSEILAKLDSLAKTLDEVRSGVALISDVRDTVEKGVSDLLKGMDDVKAAVGDVKKAVEGLSGKIDEAKGEIKSYIDTKVGEVSSKVDAIKTSVEDAKKAAEGASGAVTSYGIAGIILGIIIIALVAVKLFLRRAE